MSRSFDIDSLKNTSKSEAHTSYERYKANLHAIFDGRAPMPAHIRDLNNPDAPAAVEVKDEVVAAEPPVAKISRRRSSGQNPASLFTEALKQASTHEEMQRAVAALKEAKLEFPADEDLLSKVLTHPDEDIVIEVLNQLDALFAAHPPKNARLLATRLEDAAFQTKPGIAKDRIVSLKAKYRA
jgi:hypothetical protein